MNYCEINRKCELEKLLLEIKEEKVEYQVDKPTDKSFKNILSVKRAFINLVRDYIDKELMEEVEEENIELCDKEFITTDLQRRESDVIYRVRSKSREIYFVLVEIQSKVDYKMAYRVLEYMCEIWRKFGADREKNEKDFKLPVVIPCVLYVGKNKWNAKIQFSELFNETVRNKIYIPQFEYVLIDVERIKDAELLEKEDLLNSIFFMNKARNKNEAIERLQDIINMVSKLDEYEKNKLGNWIRGMFKINEEEYEIVGEKINNKEECKMAFADFVDEIKQDWKLQGLAEGRAEGRVEGRVEGIINAKTQTVKKLLTKKLNIELSKMQVKLIDNLDIDKLEKIEDKIFEINSWEEVREILN